MYIVLNGPLGIGKSTLAEVLSESIDGCVMLDGDKLIATNPPPKEPTHYLHATLGLLVGHHRRAGYRHFVIDYVWYRHADIVDLRRTILTVDPDAEVRVYLLSLSLEDNLERIRRRQAARAIDEQAFEHQMVLEERTALYDHADGDLGELLDVSGPPERVASRLLSELGLD